MRKKITILLLLSAGIYFSQNNPDKNAAVIKLEKEAVDYGVIEKGSEKHRQFKFTNSGKSPLVISHMNSSCGCLTNSRPKAIVLPGESQIISVWYDTNRIGVFKKYIYIISNAKNSSEYFYEVRDENGKRKKVLQKTNTLIVRVIGEVK